MEYIYAALLLHRLNKEINEENVKKIVQAAGGNPDEIKVKALVSALSEVKIDEALKAATLIPAVQAPAAPAAAAEAPKAKADEKKEEGKKEEEALAGLSSLFG